MFIRAETNDKAEAIKSWLANHRKFETQATLAVKFNKSRTFISLALNKQMVTKGAEALIDELYEYLQNRYGM